MVPAQSCNGGGGGNTRPYRIFCLENKGDVVGTDEGQYVPDLQIPYLHAMDNGAPGIEGLPLHLVTARIRPHIRGKHRLIVVGYLSGMMNVEIAEAFGCAPSTVGDVLRRPEIADEIARLSEKRTDQVIDETLRLKARYKEIAMESLEAQIELSQHGEDDKVKTTNLENILKRASAIMALEVGKGGDDVQTINVRILPPEGPNEPSTS